MNRRKRDLGDAIGDISDEFQGKMVTEHLTERAIRHMTMPKKEFEKWIYKKEHDLMDALFSAMMDNVSKFDILSPALAMAGITRGVIITIKLNSKDDWDSKKATIEEKLSEMFEQVDKNMDMMIEKGIAPPRTKTAHKIVID